MLKLYGCCIVSHCPNAFQTYNLTLNRSGRKIGIPVSYPPDLSVRDCSRWKVLVDTIILLIFKAYKNIQLLYKEQQFRNLRDTS